VGDRAGGGAAVRTFDALLQTADDVWEGSRPKTGARRSPRTRGSGSVAVRRGPGRAGGRRAASDETLRALETGNREYEERFGHVFLINATGRSAEEMLEALRGRLSEATPRTELAEAAEQQRQITRIRLEKLVRPVGLPPRDGA
jgi:hypothetical protein